MPIDGLKTKGDDTHFGGVMLKQIGLLSLLPLFLMVGCTSISGRESSSTNVVINDHIITGAGYGEVMSQAGSYCQQYGAKPVLNRKLDGSMLPFGRSEYNTYYFDCVKDQPKTIYQAPPQQKSQVSTDDAKQKCESLGLKPNTENFGNCVLRLTK